jgi:sugar phosphate isomerase/epimerase
MYHSLDRRNFLKTGAVLSAGFCRSSLGRAGLAGTPTGTPNAEKLGWRLGCQAYTFNHYTFFEAVDKNAGLGLRFIEAYPGQRISQEISTGFGDGLSARQRKTVKQKLADLGAKLVDLGVTGIDGRRTFDFAKNMGIETIVSEPGEDEFEKLDPLCGEYGINVAIHNHPQPSIYWNPDTVLKVTKGLSKRIGACCDTGHWVRSGLNAIEYLKKRTNHQFSLQGSEQDKWGCP